MNAGDGIQIGVAVVLAVTLLAVLYYARQTQKQAEATVKMADAARDQAEASARIAEAALRPVMTLWAEDHPPESLAGAEVSYTVGYKNIGNGPALNIRFCLGFADGRWLEQDTRVSMGVSDKESPLQVRVPLPIPERLFVVAEYDDASHSRWKTTLTLAREGASVILANRDSKVERIEGGS